MSEDSRNLNAPSRGVRLRVLIPGLAVLIGIAVWWWTYDPVRYHGKPLADHLVSLVRPRNSGSYQEAREALMALGDEALPVVLRNIERTAPSHIRWYLKYRQNLNTRIDTYLFKALDPNRAVNRHSGAFVALSILGTNAAPVVEELVRLYPTLDDSDRARFIRALANVGPASIPYLTPLLTGPDVALRAEAAKVIQSIGPAGPTASNDLLAGLGGTDGDHGTAIRQIRSSVSDSSSQQRTNLRTFSSTIDRTGNQVVEP